MKYFTLLADFTSASPISLLLELKTIDLVFFYFIFSYFLLLIEDEEDKV